MAVQNKNVNFDFYVVHLEVITENSENYGVTCTGYFLGE